MKRHGHATIIAVAAIAFILLCLWGLLRGELVEVKVGHVGRIKTSAGYQEEVKRPGYFRLPSTWFGTSPVKMVTAEVFDHRVEENIPKLYMPKDDLNLQFQIVGTFSIKDDAKSLDSIYNRLTATNIEGSSTSVITFEQVYNTYGQAVLRNVSQQVIASYSIDDVIRDLEGVSTSIHKTVNEHLKDSPIEVRMCGLGVVQPPDVIINAQAKAKQREIDNEKAKAEKVINITNAEANYQVGLIQQQVDLVEAETQVLSDLVLNDTVSEAYIAQRVLRVMDGMAANDNVTFLLSSKVFEDPASLIGFDGSRNSRLDDNDAEKQELLAEALRRIEKAKTEARELMAAEKAAREAELNGTQTPLSEDANPKSGSQETTPEETTSTPEPGAE